MESLPSIPEFFKNKNIFITGGSGFVGKVIVEKLLRSCPDLQNIYLLMRAKKGKSPEERIKAITDLPLFDLVKSKNPDALEKIKLVNGDVTELGLALRPEDRKLLIEKINVVIHGAASVRFDDPLPDAVFMNTRGTREIVRLALEMKNVDVLVHISTAYCNTDRSVIEEKIYPAHADWEKTIEIAENLDRDTLKILTHKYIHPLPNTYTFTKSLAEHVVYDLTKGRIPAVIFRPSIVISTAKEPFPGWIDNFNGPVGLLAAVGKGVVRTNHANPDFVMDYVPVDLIVKAIIISAWKQATIKNPKEKFDIAFYNGSNNDVRNVTVGEMMVLGKKICWEVPVNYVLWYPNGTATKCVYYHWFRVIFYQLIPALILDGLIKIAGYKPLLMRVQRRIYVTTNALQYFFSHQWQFINNRTISLENDLQPCDWHDFAYKKEEVDVYEFFRNACLGGRRYLLKESDDSLETARSHSKRMWVLAQICNLLWYLALVWIIFVRLDVISIVNDKCTDIYNYFISE